MKDKEYLVEWVIDTYADSPLAAAKEALKIQRDPNSRAIVFSVRLKSPCPECEQHSVHTMQCSISKEMGTSLLRNPIVIDLEKDDEATH